MSEAQALARTLEPPDAAMFTIAWREAGRHLALHGLTPARNGDSGAWFDTIAEMIDAARALRGNPSIEDEEKRADVIDAFLTVTTDRDVAAFNAAGLLAEDGASALAVSRGNDGADAGFLLGVAVALRFMEGAR